MLFLPLVSVAKSVLLSTDAMSAQSGILVYSGTSVYNALMCSNT